MNIAINPTVLDVVTCQEDRQFLLDMGLDQVSRDDLKDSVSSKTLDELFGTQVETKPKTETKPQVTWRGGSFEAIAKMDAQLPSQLDTASLEACSKGLLLRLLLHADKLLETGTPAPSAPAPSAPTFGSKIAVLRHIGLWGQLSSGQQEWLASRLKGVTITRTNAGVKLVFNFPQKTKQLLREKLAAGALKRGLYCKVQEQHSYVKL